MSERIRWGILSTANIGRKVIPGIPCLEERRRRRSLQPIT